MIRKDPMLILSMALPFILWALMEFLIPWIIEMVLLHWSFDLSPYYQQAGIFFLLLIPMMMGMVYGFMLLDERDGGLITLIAVTPTGKAGYLEMRLGIPVLLSLAFILFYLFLLQLELELTLIQILFISPLVASQSLIGVLFLAAFADNKVMGMALAKGLGILLIAPLLDYFLPSPLNWAGVYSPLFWSSRALLSSGGSVFWLYALITMLSQGILIWILFRKFRTRSD